MKRGPKFQRKQETIRKWLEAHGLKKISKGYELEHKIPLSQPSGKTMAKIDKALGVSIEELIN